MNKHLFKILIAIFFLSILFTLKVKATSSTYKLATHITMTSDMDINEGFKLIKPYLLYENKNACLKNYTLSIFHIEGNWYQYKGIYPDEETFSYQVVLSKIDSTCGSYVEAELIYEDCYRQSIVITDLKENKKSSDCLLEAWKSRFMNQVFPTYNNNTCKPGGNIYNNLTNFTAGSGVSYRLQYYAIYDEGGASADNTTDITTPSKQPANPDVGNDMINPGENPDSTNNQPQTPNNPKQPKDNKDTNPFLIILICVGFIIGIILIYEIYKLIRMVILWLKK